MQSLKVNTEARQLIELIIFESAPRWILSNGVLPLLPYECSHVPTVAL
jgi:hypothetical protein